MDIEKDGFEDDNELSRLEDEELGAETEEVVEEEEELVIVGEEPEEVVPAPKPASKPAAKKRAKKGEESEAEKEGRQEKSQESIEEEKKAVSAVHAGKILLAEAGPWVPAFSFCGILPPTLESAGPRCFPDRDMQSSHSGIDSPGPNSRLPKAISTARIIRHVACAGADTPDAWGSAIAPDALLRRPLLRGEVPK